MFKFFEKSFKKEETRNINEIVCPFCFNKFGPEEVLFRMSWNDESIPEAKKTIDPELFKFWKEIGNEEIGKKNQILDPSQFEDEYKKRDRGVLVGLTDTFGRETTDRNCPHCHNKLPNTAGKQPSNIISFVGSTSAGKTFYMLILIKQIMEIVCREENFDAGLIELTSGLTSLGRYRADIDNVLENGMTATPTRYLAPLVFNLKFNKTNESVTLCFYDFPGESIDDDDYLHTKANHIRNATAHMIFIDPLTIPGIRALIGDNDETYNRKNFGDLLAALNDYFIADQEGGRCSKPTAMILTKSDLLRNIDGINNQTNIFNNFMHQGIVNLNEIEKINEDCRKIIREYAYFDGTIRALFTNFSYFAISALGQSAEEGQVNAVIQPCRVEEPFLWLMYKLGFIKSLE